MVFLLKPLWAHWNRRATDHIQQYGD